MFVQYSLARAVSIGFAAMAGEGRPVWSYRRTGAKWTRFVVAIRLGVMSLHSFFTKQRSKERTIFAAIGVLFIAYGIYHLARGNWGVAAILSATGTASVLAAWLCSESVLVAISTAAILANVIAAAAAFIGGARQ